jgi:gamma-glutamylcyclotransferase (GGCT)/AIG2-like uncharacterized protein YtfP
MEKECLFTYGTFRDPEIQEILFGSSRRTRKAMLIGWSVFASDEDGYLFIKPDANGIVHGSAMELNATDLHIADRWEDVPFYRREKVTIHLENNSELAAWAYSRRQGRGMPYFGDQYSLKDRETVLAIARASKKHR